MRPQAAAVPEFPPRPASDAWANLILYAPLLGVTFFAKIATPIGGSKVILAVPMMLVAMALGLFTRRLEFDPLRTAGFLVVAAIMCAEQAFAVNAFVPSSLILLVAMTAALACKSRGAGDSAEPHIRRFLDLTLFFAVLGSAQYIGQFVVGPRYAFPLDHFLPASLITHDYNALNALHYGSTTYKATGVFLLEPSCYSQILALGFALEAAGPRRVWRLLIICVGFVFAYSGTGIVLLATALPTLIVVHRRYDLLAFILIAGVALVLLAEPLGLDLFVQRSTEFQSTDSSAYQRYVGGIHLFNQYLWSEPKRWLFGLGAGMMFRTTPWSMFNVAETGWVKVILEYGLVGSIAYYGYVFLCVLRAPQPYVLRAALATTLLLGGLTDGWSHGLILTLLIWMPPTKLHTEPVATVALDKPAPSSRLSERARAVHDPR
jgi:hypothetical protein